VSSSRQPLPRPSSKSGSQQDRNGSSARVNSADKRPPSRSSSQGVAFDLMVEVGQDDQDDKVPGEDDEPDMDLDDEEEEELVPVVSKGHGGLFGADLGSIKY